jgi:hypothetical protein
MDKISIEGPMKGYRNRSGSVSLKDSETKENLEKVEIICELYYGVILLKIRFTRKI